MAFYEASTFNAEADSQHLLLITFHYHALVFLTHNGGERMAEQFIPIFILPAIEEIVEGVGLTPLLHSNLDSLLGNTINFILASGAASGIL